MIKKYRAKALVLESTMPEEIPIPDNILEGTMRVFRLPHGWGNGYVRIPKGHRLYGHHYDDRELWCINVHGGLTYSAKDYKPCVNNKGEIHGQDTGWWCFGFDTAHYNDSKDNWPKEAVIEEALRLMEQINNYSTRYTRRKRGKKRW